MSFLVVNLPPIECFVRKEYLYDLTENEDGTLKGKGEFEPCIWISAKSLRGRAFYIESLITQYGALYDKLPLSAYVWKTDITEYLSLDELQLWDCFSYEMTIIEKISLRGLKVKYKAKNKNWYMGNYMFTIDNCVSDPNILDTSFTQVPSEHKSFNFIMLDNGQFAAQPNNRMMWYEPSHLPANPKIPDFKVSTRVYSVEDKPKFVFGDTNEYYYEPKEL